MFSQANKTACNNILVSYSENDGDINKIIEDITSLIIDGNHTPRINFLFKKYYYCLENNGLNFLDLAVSVSNTDVIMLLLRDPGIISKLDSESILAKKIKKIFPDIMIFVYFRDGVNNLIIYEFGWAIYNGDHLSVQSKLYNGINPSIFDNFAIKMASKLGHYSIVLIFLADVRVNLSAGNNYPIKWATQNGHFKIVEILINHIIKSSKDLINNLLMVASFKGYDNIVELLLCHGADPKADNCKSIKYAAEFGHFDVVKRLLKDKRSNPTIEKNHVIKIASSNGFDKIVELLLQDYRVNAGDDDNYSIKMASLNGHHKVVKLLLGDEKVNAGADSNYALKAAIDNDHFLVVQLLMGNHRVNPAIQNNMPIKMAVMVGCHKLVKQLLTDYRVNPSVDKNYAIKYAVNNGNIEIVKLLAQSRNFNITYDEILQMRQIALHEKYHDIYTFFIQIKLKQTYPKKNCAEFENDTSKIGKQIKLLMTNINVFHIVFSEGLGKFTTPKEFNFISTYKQILKLMKSNDIIEARIREDKINIRISDIGN